MVYFFSLPVLDIYIYIYLANLEWDTDLKSYSEIAGKFRSTFKLGYSEQYQKEVVFVEYSFRWSIFLDTYTSNSLFTARTYEVSSLLASEASKHCEFWKNAESILTFPTSQHSLLILSSKQSYDFDLLWYKQRQHIFHTKALLYTWILGGWDRRGPLPSTLLQKSHQKHVPPNTDKY